MINFCFGENVVYTFFEANAWRGVAADNFPPVLIFLKKTYKLCYNYHCVCASSRVHSEIWGKK